MLAKSEQGLLGLPLVVFRMILGFLHQDDAKTLYALRSMSRACRYECDALLFRTCKLQDHVCRHASDIQFEEEYGDPGRMHQEDFRLRRATEGLVQCLLDGESPIAPHVQHLQIGTLQQDVFDSIIAPVLGKVLTRLINLQSLSWDTNIPVPEPVLDVFHTTHATARLHVTNCLRERKPLDRLLLSSPQLHSLQMNVYFDLVGVCPVIRGSSELQILKRCLMQGNSIKVLHLALENVDKYLYGSAVSGLGIQDWENGLLNFHWQVGDRFPALEEWGWSGSTHYVYSEQQLDMWRRCMDWTQLRVLDFGDHPLTSMLPFPSLTGHVPRLNSLAVFISAQKQDDMHEPTRTIPIFEEFLCSVLALKKLRLTWSFIPDCLSTILELQGHSLRQLELYHPRSGTTWDQHRYIEILTKAPQLHHLRVRHLSSQGPTVDFQGTWYGHAIDSSPFVKYTAMEDVSIEERAQSERKHAAMMKRISDRRKAQASAAERMPEEIAQVIELAQRNPRGD
ncbi:hypothetical protein COCVIDRAFT_112878 [Bipolaris victoriae FI3]|uniref:F-box domain-containing protein n=1 Tax=Bipolaris victoriae (strain FI3) TaxID=930091 RepID=W7DUU2_BIPV3|nr:hypothetical protein COCVIDRAFT_112878 [Bipolaris victoriae FI3]